MASVNLFSRNKPKIGAITLDASIREEHAIDNDITSEPVEDGSTITDNIVTQPRVLAMEVMLTSHTDTVLPSGSNTRHIQIYRQLQRLAKAKEVFDVVTTLERYRNMAFRRCGTPRTVENTNALVVTCILRQIEIARVDEAANLAEIAQDIALGEENLGSQGAADLAGEGVLAA